MPRQINRNAKRVAVYLLPKVAHDRVVLDAWHAATNSGRVQETLRRALFLGLQAMFEAGELPDDILNQGHPPLRETLARRGMPRAFVAPSMPAPAMVSMPPAPVPMPSFAPRTVLPEEPPPRPPEQPPDEDELDLDGLMSLMGGSQPAVREDA